MDGLLSPRLIDRKVSCTGCREPSSRPVRDWGYVTSTLRPQQQLDVAQPPF